MINKAPILTLQGRVNKSILKKLKIKTHSFSANKDWFFADYSIQDIPLHTSFDVLLEGDSKKLLRNKATIKIVTVIDQFGNKLPSVPEGFKTICRLEFHPSIPIPVKKLPLLEKWHYHAAWITLAQHQGIELGIEETVLNDLYSIAYTQFKEAANNIPVKDTLTKNEFIEVATQSLKTNSDNAEKLLQTFLQMGKIKQKNNQLQLEEIE